MTSYTENLLRDLQTGSETTGDRSIALRRDARTAGRTKQWTLQSVTEFLRSQDVARLRYVL